MVHFLLRKGDLCSGEGDCNRLRPCVCCDKTHEGALIRGCGHTWETASESPDGCPKCGEWRTVAIDRCYECPLTAMDEEMDSSRGRQIGRAFHKLNLMKAGVRYGPDDLSAEEAYLIEMIELEKPISGLSLTDGVNRGA